MGKKGILKLQGAEIEFDHENVSLILSEPIERGTDPHELNLKISDDIRAYPTMGYTTDLATLELIFKFMTLRSISLTNANLNDPMEKERVGVSDFAGNRFITCFCHLDHESVPFWMYYGKDIRKNKVLMLFHNFADSFEKCIYTDYALVNNGKQALFKSPKNNNLFFGESVRTYYDLSGIIDAVLMFDVEYVPGASEIFTKEYAGDAQIDFENKVEKSGDAITVKTYDTAILGKQKSNPWDYEKETRILSVVSGGLKPDWEYIDLRLKPEMFRGLKIVLSPWDEGDLKEKVEKAINDSSLPQDVKDSICIVDSVLKGKLNFPEQR